MTQKYPQAIKEQNLESLLTKQPTISIPSSTYSSPNISPTSTEATYTQSLAGSPESKRKVMNKNEIIKTIIHSLILIYIRIIII